MSKSASGLGAIVMKSEALLGGRPGLELEVSTKQYTINIPHGLVRKGTLGVTACNRSHEKPKELRKRQESSYEVASVKILYAKTVL